MSRTIKGTRSASGRRHWSEEEARRWVEAWLESGQTQADVAREHDIHAERLARWARRLTDPAEAPEEVSPFVSTRCV